MAKTSVIIPCHNDYDLLLEVIDNLNFGIDKSDVEIVVVNDGSVSDDGRFKPFSFDPFKYPNVAVINNPIQRGVGASFDSGFKYSTGGIIVLMGSDIFTHKRSWLQSVNTAVRTYPNTIGCAVCVGLEGDNRDLDFEGRNLRYGAELLFQVDASDLSVFSTIPEKYPNYQALFEARWLNQQMSYEPYQIPCALGAFYFTSREYYHKIGGWDTDPNKRFQGHKIWGALEPHLSLKSHLCGGGVTLFPNIEAGHVFGRIPQDKLFEKRAIRHDYMWFNRLWVAETMVFDENLRKQIISFIRPTLNFNKAKQYIRKNYDNVLRVRERNKQRFTVELSEYMVKYSIKLK